MLPMSDSEVTPPQPCKVKKMAWSEKRPKKKNVAYYAAQRTKYVEYVENEFLAIPETLNVVNTRTISLLTTDGKIWKFNGVSRETMEQALNCLKIGPKMLARKSNAILDILLASEQEAKQLVRSVLMSKVVRLQSEYMGTHRMKIAIHCVPGDISEDRICLFFSEMAKWKTSVL